MQQWTPGQIKESMLLYAVTDRAWLQGRTLAGCVRQVIAGGATFVQLREKEAPFDEVVALGRELVPICHEAGVPFVIDDDVEAAIACGADGVHVGQSDMACEKARELLGPDAIVGVSVQTVEQALAAQAAGASYLGVGALIPTPTKPDAVDVTFDELRAICGAVDIPVVGIGGLNARTIPQLAGSNVDGAAVVSALFAADDCEAAARELRVECEKAVTGKGAMKSVLTIAGSDSSGGAGIQADIKTIEAHHLFAQSAITALTAQNTTGVYGVLDVTPEFVAQQIDVVFDDIRPDAVKIGMVSSAAIVQAIAEALVRNNAANIVVDPVMVATSGSELASSGAVRALRDKLIPLASVITPNIPESEVLFGAHIEAREGQERAAVAIAASTGVPVLVKGGHDANDANDVLAYPDGAVVWFEGERIDNPNTHGTGCTLSSAIACGLAAGLSLEDSIAQAKRYISGALAAQLNLGKGSGPLDHMWEC